MVCRKSIDTCATHLLACSNLCAKWLFSGKADIATILKMELIVIDFCSVRNEKTSKRKLQLEQDALVIGHVGRFAHQKSYLPYRIIRSVNSI